MLSTKAEARVVFITASKKGFQLPQGNVLVLNKNRVQAFWSGTVGADTGGTDATLARCLVEVSHASREIWHSSCALALDGLAFV